MGKYVSSGVGVAKSENFGPEESEKVGRKAVKEALKKIENEDDGETFGFLFCSSYYDVESLVNGASDEFGDIEWVGGTTSGELSQKGFSNKSCVAMVVSSEYMKFNSWAADRMHERPIEAGKEAARNSMKDLNADEYLDAYVHYQALKKKSAEEVMNISPYAMIVLTSGFTTEKPSLESEVIKGIKKVTSNNIPIIGGSTGDDSKISENFQFLNGNVYTDAVVAISILSDLKLGIGLSHGFDSTGEVVFVNKVENNRIVTQLNGEPAAEKYAELLGVDLEELKGSITLPTGAELPKTSKFALKNPFGQMTPDGEAILKTPLGVTEENGLIFAPKISENVALHLMKSNDKLMINAADQSLKEAQKADNDIGFALLFDCSLRWMKLKEKTRKEIDIIKENIDSPFAGFYTYGEIGSHRGGNPSLHNLSVSSLVVYDSLVAEDNS